MSLPLSACTVSLPPRAQMTSRTPVPRSSSPCPVPTMVHGASFQRGFAADGVIIAVSITPTRTPTTTMRCLSITDLLLRASDRSWHEPSLPPRDQLGIARPHDERAHDRTPSARRYPVQYATSEPSLRRRTAVEVDGLFDTEGNHHPGEAMRRHPEGPARTSAVNHHDDELASRPETCVRAPARQPHRRPRIAHAGQRAARLGPHPSLVHQHLGRPPKASSTRAPGETARSAARDAADATSRRREPTMAMAACVPEASIAIMPPVAPPPPTSAPSWITGCAGPFPAARSPLTASSARSRDATSRSVA